MKSKLIISGLFLTASLSLPAQKNATITVQAEQGTQIIPKEIYGQFAEHLGYSMPSKICKSQCSAGRVVALPTNTTGWTVSVPKKIAPKW